MKFIKERGYVYVRYNIERRRALIKFGKNPGDTTLGALAIENIAFKDGKWLGDFRVYEYTVEDFTVEDLVQLSNLVFTERVSRAMSRGYLRINGRVVKGYGIKPINEELESLLRKMFSEVYGSNQVISG
ncbi:hypothetical protein [Metallosphaera javensis (ex Sakai et al. 2022)]|uniref:hypothetical protein n=1 Tax=Metallosphaera javensis (ex Sakai et al. 2022) TaxID=2775498 RepID=UPI00258EB4B9|nr:MAG: hypothetical protein MjAS7_0116 [Metallosphaera javensis (ex Sakai et al. 2022)]